MGGAKGAGTTPCVNLDAATLREWLRIPAHLDVPVWAGPRLGEAVRDELEARRGLRLEETVFGIVDLETTGTSSTAHRILEVGLVVQRGGRVLETFETLVDVGAAVPSGITALTGISTDLLEGAPDESSVLASLAEVLARTGTHVLVAHNARFDRAFLEHAWRDHDMTQPLPDFLCSVRLARRCVRAPGYGLDRLVRHLAIRPRARHRALGDAEMTADLWLELLGRSKLSGVHTLEALRANAEVGRTRKSRRRIRMVADRPYL